MARTEKISITVDAAVLAGVKKRARAEKKNLSAFISDVLADQLRQEALGQALAAFEREHGAIAEARIEKAKKRLESAWSRKRKSRRAA